MLAVSVKDEIRNELICQRSKVTEIALKAGSGNGLVIYVTEQTSWSKSVLELRPRFGT